MGNQSEDKPTVTIPFGRTLRIGNAGKDVKAVKRALARAGHGRLAGVTPIFGPFARINLQNFQRKHRLTPDGVYGPVTHKALTPHFDAYSRLLYIAPKPLPGPAGGLQLPSSFRPTHPTAGLDGYPAVDVFAKAGTRVLCPEDGTITRLSGKDPKLGGVPGSAYGWNIYLDARSGTYFLAHFGSRLVTQGQKVRKGQPLGTVCDAAVARMPSSASHIHEGKRSR